MSRFMYGRAINDAMNEAALQLSDEMKGTRRAAQERVRTRITNPFDAVHELQNAARKHPDIQTACDNAITVILMLGDKHAAALSALKDVEWER